jgi:hypothetical protein
MKKRLRSGDVPARAVFDLALAASLLVSTGCKGSSDSGGVGGSFPVDAGACAPDPLHTSLSAQGVAVNASGEIFMAGRPEALPPDLRTEDAIHRELTRALPANDPFWAQWIVTHRERYGHGR